MPGVQSFVAQRQQGQPNPSRQLLGAQHRVPVPTTKLENIKQKPPFQRPNPNLPANPPVAGSITILSRQQAAEASAVQDGFDTDAEGFDDTATMKVGGSSRGHQSEGDDRDQISSRYGTDVPNEYLSGAQVSFRRRQEQPHQAQGSRRLDAEGSGEDGEANLGECADDEEDEESEKEESVRDGILQDLNSSGFYQYLQGESSHTTEVAFQPVVATPVVHSELALREIVQRHQKPANPFTSRGNSVDGGAADPGVNLQRANRQARERAMKQTSAVPVQKVQLTSRQALQPMSRARLRLGQDTVATSVQPQATEEWPLSVQTGSSGLSDDDSAVDWDPNVNRGQDMEPTASIDGPQTRKRARDLDYSPDQISSMTFNQLTNEPFNLASDTARVSIPQELSNGTLAAKVDYILEKLKDDDTKLVHRRAFFSSLSIEQYEECANLIIQRFSDVMSKFTDARQQRRRAAKDFEEEVAKREACVRGKATVVDKDLDRLKRGGEEVVRGAAL